MLLLIKGICVQNMHPNSHDVTVFYLDTHKTQVMFSF
jgi:hypothetical protein